MASDIGQARPAAVPDPTGRRPALTREQVLAAALEIIDESGVEIYQTLSFVGWGLCAASAATSAVLFVLAADGGSPDEGEASVALRVAPTRIDLSGRF